MRPLKICRNDKSNLRSSSSHDFKLKRLNYRFFLFLQFFFRIPLANCVFGVWIKVEPIKCCSFLQKILSLKSRKKKISPKNTHWIAVQKVSSQIEATVFRTVWIECVVNFGLRCFRVFVNSFDGFLNVWRLDIVYKWLYSGAFVFVRFFSAMKAQSKTQCKLISVGLNIWKKRKKKRWLFLLWNVFETRIYICKNTHFTSSITMLWASWWLFCWSFLFCYSLHIVSNNIYFKLVLFIPNAHATISRIRMEWQKRLREKWREEATQQKEKNISSKENDNYIIINDNLTVEIKGTVMKKKKKKKNV